MERTMPLPALVFQVAAQEADRWGQVEGWNDPQYMRVGCALAGGGLTGEKIRADTAANGEDVEALKKESQALKALLEGDAEKASKVCIVGRLKAFGTPIMGWPAGWDGNHAWAAGVHESFAGLPELVGRVVKDVEHLGDGVPQSELEAAMLQAIYKHAPIYWTEAKAIAQRTRDGRPDAIQVDYTGKSPAPVHFIATGSIDYQGSPQGWQISQHGAQWLSGTHVQGNAITLAVNISQAASMEKASTNENTSDGTAIDRNTQGVEIR
ncbi:hypothetical protein PQC53_31885 (plasmid) [Pseudomonas aeruginosa]|nr:hypothetical protein PQC53_31885 [Pseudomonas aeruginosa]